MQKMALEWDEPLANAVAIVAQRNLPSAFLDDAAADAIEGELHKLTHVKLDREHLTCVPPPLFLLLPNLTNLYLQQNELTSLKALETATGLRFLTVAGNQIRALEGSLSFLPHLLFLDLSDNFIEDINADVELPKSLSFLNLTNNPCCQTQEGLYQMLESCLTNLKELNWEDPLTDEPVNWEDDGELEEDTDGMSYNTQVYLEDDEREVCGVPVAGFNHHQGHKIHAQVSRYKLCQQHLHVNKSLISDQQSPIMIRLRVSRNSVAKKVHFRFRKWLKEPEIFRRPHINS